jgi:hypothetical protein
MSVGAESIEDAEYFAAEIYTNQNWRKMKLWNRSRCADDGNVYVTARHESKKRGTYFKGWRSTRGIVVELTKDI